MNQEHLEQQSEHHYTYKTDTMHVPAHFLMAEDLLPNEETFVKTEDIACNDCLFHHTAAMPDVMSKPGRKNASGSTVVSATHILPQLNDSDPNCSMRVVKTNLMEGDLTEADIDKLFKALVPEVPTKTLKATTVPFDTVVDICRGGTKYLIDHLGIETKNELENSQGGGNYFGEEISREELFEAIPKLYLHFAQFRLGLLGAAGNHFFDLMKVEEIVDPEIAEKFGLKKGQYLLMIHTGSGILGQYTMYTYTAKKREHVSQSVMVTLGRMTFSPGKNEEVYKAMQRKIRAHMTGDDSLLKFEANKPEGDLYMTARAAASNFGLANRATITHKVSETIKEVLGVDPEMELLYDLPHISIDQESHYGQDVWVHRNNTSRAYGPSRMGHHPVFKETGEPVFIPSSMSTGAFICVGTDRNEAGYFSAPHGTGKKAKVEEGTAPTTKEELFKKMDEKGVKLYNAKSSQVIKQDSSNYKDVDRVIEGVEANGIAHVVAKMKPVAVIMY